MSTKSILIIGLIFVFGFCTPRKLLIKKTPKLPDSGSRLYEYSLKQNVSFQTMVINNLKLKYQTSNNHSRLSGAVKMIKDSAILLSLRAPLGIELSRILYTPDSLKMLDRRKKKAYFSDYDNLSDIVPVDLDFQILQTIFTGNIPENYRNAQMPEPKFVRDSARNETYLGTFLAPDSGNYMPFYGWIYSDMIRPSYLIFYRQNNNKQYRISYFDYQEKANHYFPGRVKISFDQYNRSSILELELKDISFQQDGTIHLEVPSSYKRIEL